MFKIYAEKIWICILFLKLCYNSVTRYCCILSQVDYEKCNLMISLRNSFPPRSWQVSISCNSVSKLSESSSNSISCRSMAMLCTIVSEAMKFGTRSSFSRRPVRNAGKRLFQTPKALSTTFLVAMWATLYLFSAVCGIRNWRHQIPPTWIPLISKYNST